MNRVLRNYSASSWLILFLVGWLSACTTNSEPGINEPNSPTSKITIVGKVEIVPPLEPDLEQSSRWNEIGTNYTRNAIFLVMDTDFRPLDPDQLLPPPLLGAIKAELGEPFATEISRHHNKLRGAVVNLDTLKQEQLYFPGGLYFDASPNATAVYIGTLRYTRNDFNVIEKVEVIDEFSEASLFLASKSNSGFRLEKSLLKTTSAR